MHSFFRIKAFYTRQSSRCGIGHVFRTCVQGTLVSKLHNLQPLPTYFHK